MGITEGPSCPLPLPHHDRIILGHGSGGKLTDELISRIFYPCFENPALRQGNDSAALTLEDGARIAVSTDAHVVSPLFFPGGDIGRLAVCGTVNDVAMSGAVPQYLTAGFILEEGLEVSLLSKVVESMRQAAEEAGVQIVAGDTKVVQRGKADGLYITTAGVGILPPGRQIGGANAKPGDLVLLSGPLGDHGIAVLAARGELGFETDLHSDVAPLNHLIAAMLDASQNVHVLRDPTRGGLGTTLNEIATQSKVGIQIDEASLPVRPAVAAACEMLGFDPLYIANEGKLVAIVAKEDSKKVLQAMRRTKYGEEAVEIGEILPAPSGRVLLRSRIGGTRLVERLSGELLPRIC